MNIFYFSSDLFIEVLAVSLVSLLENNKNCKEINVYIVDDGITKEKKNKLQGMVDKYSSTENIRKIFRRIIWNFFFQFLKRSYFFTIRISQKAIKCLQRNMCRITPLVVITEAHQVKCSLIP